MPYKIAPLIIHDSHHSQKAGEILIQPAPGEDQGDLLVLVEIDSRGPKDYQFIEQLLKTVYQVYESSIVANVEKTLELILQKLNQEIPQFLPQQRKWLGNFHCLIALFSDNHLYFSTYGKIKVYLIKSTLIKEVVGKVEEEEKGIFTYTLSGELNPEDKILITTESLTNYLSLEKIKKIIATLPPQSAVAHFNNILQTSSPEVSFFVIILQAGAKKIASIEAIQIPTKLSTPLTSQNSINQLLAVERETEKILTPPSFIQLIKERLKRKVAPLRPRPAKKTIKPAPISLPERYLINFLRWLISLIKKFWPYLSSLTKLKGTISNWFTKTIIKFKSSSKLNRALIIIIVILLFLLTQNLIWLSRKQAQLKNEEKYQQLLGEIENKQNGIEASLIYNDTVRAKQLLEEIFAISESLPQNSKERIAKYQQVSEGIQILYERVWKVTNILEPLCLINFNEFNPYTHVYQIALRDNLLYGFNISNQLFTFNLINNQKQINDNFNLRFQNLALFPKINKIIGQTLDHKFYSILDGQPEEISLNLPQSLQQIDDLTFFLDKMYLLDKASNQIFRLTQSGNNFTLSLSWLKDNYPVNSAISMAVDGYLYLLLENGQIQRFASGKKQDFPSKITVEPSLNSPIKLFTDAETTYLYVLDPPNKRFLVLTKEGEVKSQYYSEKFNNLKDFIVKEKDKKVYLLNGSNVFVVAIQ